MKQDNPVVVSSNDGGDTWRAYQVADEARENLEEIDRRDRQMERIRILTISIIVAGLSVVAIGFGRILWYVLSLGG